jgi:cell division initiation protein
MKITPLEIRQKTFEKVFRGYDKDEVTAYLISLSHEWEKILDENKELRLKLDHAEKEINKLREVESSLYKTLKTAEDTGANMIQQANKAAELQLKETKMKAEAIVRDAKGKSNAILEKTEKQARDIVRNMLEEVKTLEQNFNLVLNVKESMISDLKNLSNDTLERVQKFTEKKEKLNIDQYLKKAREFADNHDIKNFVAEEATPQESPKKDQKPSEKPENEKKGTEGTASDKKEGKHKSFFDMID